MPMPNFTFKDYIEGIKAKYEEEKTKSYSGYLAKPSPAQLKNLCDILKKKNTSKKDQEIISSFYNTVGFDIDKFKPIGNFFSGKTQSPSHDILDMMALLVDFEPRPLGKFLERNNHDIEEGRTSETVISDSLNGREPSKTLDPQNQEAKSSLNRKVTITISLAFCVIIILLICNTITTHKDCLEWKKDRYIEVDCKTKVNGSVDLDILYDESLLKRRKITPTDTTTYFKNGNAIIWYCKDSEGNLELFNFPGYHPVTGKPLHHITDYILKKHIKR